MLWRTKATSSHPLLPQRLRSGRALPLEEEFDLFQLLYRAARCYDLNTILALAPSPRDKKEAVGRTIELLTVIIDRLPEGLSLNLENYGDFLSKEG